MGCSANHAASPKCSKAQDKYAKKKVGGAEEEDDESIEEYSGDESPPRQADAVESRSWGFGAGDSEDADEEPARCSRRSWSQPEKEVPTRPEKDCSRKTDAQVAELDLKQVPIQLGKERSPKLSASEKASAILKRDQKQLDAERSGKKSDADAANAVVKRVQTQLEKDLSQRTEIEAILSSLDCEDEGDEEHSDLGDESQPSQSEPEPGGDSSNPGGDAAEQKPQQAMPLHLFSPEVRDYMLKNGMTIPDSAMQLNGTSSSKEQKVVDADSAIAKASRMLRAADGETSASTEVRLKPEVQKSAQPVPREARPYRSEKATSSSRELQPICQRASTAPELRRDTSETLAVRGRDRCEGKPDKSELLAGEGPGCGRAVSSNNLGQESQTGSRSVFSQKSFDAAMNVYGDAVTSGEATRGSQRTKTVISNADIDAYLEKAGISSRPSKKESKRSAAPVPSQVDRKDPDKDVLEAIDLDLREMKGLSLSERKQFFQQQVLKWHPDKNREKPELAKKVFQYLQDRKAWFLS